MSDARALIDARRSLLMQRLELILAIDDHGNARRVRNDA
jgi:hypothetical protein